MARLAWQPGFVAASGLSATLIFVLTLAMRLRRPRHLADAVIDWLNAGYANVGFVGFR
jgi:malonate transporter